MENLTDSCAICGDSLEDKESAEVQTETQNHGGIELDLGTVEVCMDCAKKDAGITVDT